MSKRLNILYLVNRRVLKKACSRTISKYDAIGKIAYVKYWGIGWSGYSSPFL